MKLNVDAHLWCIGGYAERYVPGGYYDDISLEKKLDIFSKTKGLTGFFALYPAAPMPEDPDKFLKKLADYNLVVSNVAPSFTWSDPAFKMGAFSTTDPKILKESIRSFKEAIDFAKAVKADSVLLWLAHDGFDYVFQADYKDAWKRLVETVRELGEYNPAVKIALEAKSKDPRQKQYINDTGKALTFINEVGLSNVGCAFDIGHALMAKEGLAESVALLNSHKKLFQIHINENYRDADPDMVFGTINFWELLEFFYFFNKTNYEGWSAIDIISPREDPTKALALGVKLIWKYKEMADKLMKYEKEIDSNMAGYHFADNMNLITDIILK